MLTHKPHSSPARISILNLRRALILLTFTGLSVGAFAKETEQSDGFFTTSDHLDRAVERCLNPSPEAPHIQRDADCKQALTHLERASDSEQLAQVFGRIAMNKLAQQDLEAASTAIQSALRVSPNNPIVQGNYGVVLMHMNDFRLAIDAFNNALFDAPIPLGTPAQAALYLNRSLALRALGNYDEATKDYALYLQLTGFSSTQTTTPTQRSRGQFR